MKDQDTKVLSADSLATYSASVITPASSGLRFPANLLLKSPAPFLLTPDEDCWLHIFDI
jgi:hypothetical protein